MEQINENILGEIPLEAQILSLKRELEENKKKIAELKKAKKVKEIKEPKEPKKRGRPANFIEQSGCEFAVGTPEYKRLYRVEERRWIRLRKYMKSPEECLKQAALLLGLDLVNTPEFRPLSPASIHHNENQGSSDEDQEEILCNYENEHTEPLYGEEEIIGAVSSGTSA
jgi:hypothetical protein